MCGEQPHRVAADAPLGQGVGRDLLGLDLGEEVLGTRVVALLLGAGGHLEQGADRVEVTVCGPGGRAASLDRPAQPTRPAGACPERPEGLLGRAAPLENRVGVLQEPGESAGSGGQPVLDVDEEGRVDQRLAQQVAGRARQPLGVRLAVSSTELPAELADAGGVEVGQRRHHEHPRGVLGQ